MPGSSRTLKACGGLAPYAWSVAGPATLSATGGTATTVTCNQGTTDATPVVLTVTDAAGVSVSSVLGGSCACAGCVCADTNSPTQCPVNYMHNCWSPGKVTFSGTQFGYDHDSACTTTTPYYGILGAGSANVDCSSNGGMSIFYSSVNPILGSPPATVTQIAVASYDVAVPVFSNLVGNPSYGLVVNCPVGVTCTNFTGLVLLFDNDADTVVLGQYTNANLDNGDRPAIIETLGSGIDKNDVYEIEISNGFLFGGPKILVYVFGYVLELESTSQTALPDAGDPVGVGFFFLKKVGGSFVFNYDTWSFTTFWFV